ncbi:MAG: ParA family protein [Planctomycetota bacterium]
MGTTIVTANQKGGCGKTTTVVSLASALAEKGYQVTIVDCDPQTNATQAFGVEAEDLGDDQFTVVDAYLAKKPADQIEMHFPDRFGGRLHLVPGSRGISTVQFRFDAQINERLATQEITQIDADNLKDEQRKRLRSSIDSLKGTRDFVLIDTGPELQLVLTTAMIAADRYIIPMIPSGFDLKGLKLLTKAVNQIRDRYQPNLSMLGLLLTKLKRSNLDMEVRELLLSIFNEDELFDAGISDSVRHREATMSGKTIHEHAPGEPASEQYMQLADEVLSRLGNPKPVSAEAEQGKGAEAAQTIEAKPESTAEAVGG